MPLSHRENLNPFRTIENTQDAIIFETIMLMPFLMFNWILPFISKRTFGNTVCHTTKPLGFYARKKIEKVIENQMDKLVQAKYVQIRAAGDCILAIDEVEIFPPKK